MSDEKHSEDKPAPLQGSRPEQSDVDVFKDNLNTCILQVRDKLIEAKRVLGLSVAAEAEYNRVRSHPSGMDSRTRNSKMISAQARMNDGYQELINAMHSAWSLTENAVNHTIVLANIEVDSGYSHPLAPTIEIEIGMVKCMEIADETLQLFTTNMQDLHRVMESDGVRAFTATLVDMWNEVLEFNHIASTHS